MSIDQNKPDHTAARVSARWRAVQDGYRTLNAVTHNAASYLLRLLLVAYFIFCALFLGLRYVVLPNIDNYKGNVERIVTHAIGSKVSIASIQASWKGLRPHLALGDVTVHDRFGNEALRLPKVSATLSWLSVAVGGLRLQSLEIERPDMDVLRDTEGNLYVAGIFIDTRKSGGAGGTDWLLSQREIVIRDGKLRWTDLKRGAPELLLDGVNLVLRNHWLDHQFALKAVPQAGFSAPLDIRATFRHPAFARSISDATLWKGDFYADLPDTDLTAWKAYVDYPIEMQQGTGSVRAWLHFDHAKIADFTADLRLSNVSARLRHDLQPLHLTQVSGRVSVREPMNPHFPEGIPTFGTNGHEISLTDFSLETSDGLRLPTTTIRQSYVPAKNGQPEKTEISAKLLDLKTLAEFAERLPLPAEQREALTDFEPHGVLKDFSVRWQGAYPDISTYGIKGEFVDLSMNGKAPQPARPKSGKIPAKAAVPGIPGFDNITGRVDATEKGGTFSLASTGLKLHLPGYFVDPVLPFDRLDMQADWVFKGDDQLLLEVRQMDFRQDGLSGSLSGRHLMPLNGEPGKPAGTIDLSGKFTGLDLRRIGSYLPLSTPQSLHDWLAGALVGGTADDVRLKIKGDMAHFPFDGGDQPKGEFSIVGKIRDGHLNYSPGHFAKDGKSPAWPVIEAVNGTIAFDRTRMEIDAQSARTHNVALSRVKAVIPDLLADNLDLRVEGDAAGALQDFVRFANDSHVADWIGHFTDETKAAGNARLALKLQLPLRHLTEAKVQGALQFANNNVTLQNLIPPLTAASGKLEFNEKGFNLNGIRASFLGGPVAVTGGTQRDGSVQLRADGSLTADGVSKAYATPLTQQSSERISGGTRYTASIKIRDKRPEIVIESGLQGLALDFPEPLRKAAGESLPLKFELTGLPSDDTTVMRDEIRLSLGSAIAAYYERRKTAGNDGAWRVVRGGIGVNEPAPVPDSGVIANATVDSLNIDAWRRAVASIAAAGADTASAASPDTLGIAQYIEPEVLAARAGELILMDKKLVNVVVGASHQKGVWQANIDSEQASGYVTWNQSQSGRGLGRVTARLASLIIPESAASDVTDLLEGKNAATQMPGLDIVAENFELFGKRFGHLELAANNVRGTQGREWRIDKLSISNPDGELQASGKWSSLDGDSVSNLSYTLKIDDAGMMLNRFGFANLLRGGKGQMEGSLSWKGLPFSLDIPSLSGQFQLDIASGQFLKVEPGAAKLLGVLNMQSLPRRLALDFRDVFSEGFAFDGVTAAATIARGVARTDNFKMRGVAATVLIDGTADIAKESQDLHVAVIPEINVGAASVVYGLAVNPAIGVGTFLAQLFLRDPLMKAFTFEYQVTGPWKEPVVTKLVRKPSSQADEIGAVSGVSG